MGDILSQSEIDSLLNSISSGELTNEQTAELVSKKVEIKEYNFAKPPKFNKDHLRTLEIIFDNYARIVSSYLTGYLRTNVIIEVNAAEQITYKEFSTSLPNYVILSILEFLPLKGSVILELSAKIGYSIIDRILGGPGLGLKKLRDFSEIEKVLLKRIITQMLNYLVEPWENVLELKPKLEKIETNSQFAQIISPNEMIALISLSIKVGETEGFMNFCLPHLVIEPVIQKLNTRYWFTSNIDDETDSYKVVMEEKLEEASLSVSAVLGKTNISVQEFLELQVGDIVTLDSYISSDLEILVGDHLKYYAKPGISRKKNSIQITGLVGRDDN